MRSPDARPAAGAAPEQRQSLPVPAIAAAALIAAVVGFVGGTSGGGQAVLESAAGNGFVLQAPAGWNPAPANLIAALGSQAVALAPPGAATGQGVAATRLPTAQAVALVAGDPAHVKLDAGEAVRSLRDGTTFYVLPTDTDALVIGCTSAAVVSSRCDTIAGSAKLTGGRAVAPGPTVAGGRALRAALTRLRAAITGPTDELGAATSPKAEARAADGLGQAFSTASGQVGTAPVGALATGLRDRLATALKALGSGWAAYASAADGSRPTSTAAGAGSTAGARSSIARARANVAQAGAALAAAGYPADG